MGEDDTELLLVEQARRALIEARTLPEIRRVMEAATVAADANRRAASLAQAQQLATDVVEAAEDAANDAAAVRIEAQAKAGEMLRQMQERGERVRTSTQVHKESQPATLDDLGVTKSASSRWQQVADVPEPVRQEYVEQAKAQRDEVTTSGLLQHAQMTDTEAFAEVERQSDPERAAVLDASRRRKQWLDATARSHALIAFDPEEVADLLEPHHRTAAFDMIQRWRDWCDRMEQALTRSLEIVK